MLMGTPIVVGTGIFELGLLCHFGVLKHAFDGVERFAHLLFFHGNTDSVGVRGQPIELSPQFGEEFAAAEDGSWNLTHGLGSLCLLLSFGRVDSFAHGFDVGAWSRTTVLVGSD